MCNLLECKTCVRKRTIMFGANDFHNTDTGKRCLDGLKVN